MKKIVFGILVVGICIYTPPSSAIYHFRLVGRCVTTIITDSSGYVWTNQQCWMEYEGYGSSDMPPDNPYPDSGGAPTTSAPYDLDSDGLMDCWKDLTAAGDYELAGNQDWGPRPGDPFHDGIDIAAAQGTSVHAIAEGVVAEAMYNSWNGNYVRINHPDGTQSVYLHLLEYSVSTGDSIFPGQNIGRVNNSGSSEGNHLHITVWNGQAASARVEGTSLNPMDYAGGEACQK